MWTVIWDPTNCNDDDTYELKSICSTWVQNQHLKSANKLLKGFYAD